MSQPIISRESMRGLKAQTDEAQRLNTISLYIKNIYSGAVQTARSTEKTLHQWPIPSTDPRSPANIFTTSMADILKGLQELFPDCLVEYKILARGRDGKMHDIPKMDKAVLPFVGAYTQQAYIVIDWS